MTVSVSAARLFADAFKRGDFTGWPDFVRMDDGQYMTQLMLSVSRRKVVYSVMARTRDPRGREFVFILCVDQAARGMESLHNKVGVMDAVLITKDGDPRLVVCLDYGEYLVLDAVEQPAVRSLDEARGSFMSTVNDPERSKEGDTDDMEDDMEDDLSSEEPPPGFGAFVGNLKDRASVRSAGRSKAARVRANMPPRDRFGLKRSRRFR